MSDTLSRWLVSSSPSRWQLTSCGDWHRYPGISHQTSPPAKVGVSVGVHMKLSSTKRLRRLGENCLEFRTSMLMKAVHAGWVKT